MKREKTNKKSKQRIVIERYEILQKAKKLKAKVIKYKDMEGIFRSKRKDFVSLRKFVKFSQIQYNYFKIHIIFSIEFLTFKNGKM